MVALFVGFSLFAFGQSPSPAPPGGEASRWYLIKAEDQGTQPQHRGEYEFWVDQTGVLKGAMLLRSGTGRRPLYELQHDGNTLSFRQQPTGPRLVLKGVGDKFQGTWDSGLTVPLVLVRAWD
jgi:hypothetical protein